jgi:adenylosuccinate lyase
MSRAEAKQLIKQAGQEALAQNRHLVDVMQEKNCAPIDWQALKNEMAYLGSAQTFIDRVLAEAERVYVTDETSFPN